MILIDAGPLVAWVTPKDPHHQRCIALTRTLPIPLFTTLPVVAETCWLIRKYAGSLVAVRNLFASKHLQLLELTEDALPWMLDFMLRYNNIGADLADASLMYIAEQHKVDEIFTLDRRDFSVYRTTKNRALKIIP